MLALFHLFNHAFFKALLFLGAGAIIHALLDEQDIRKMGGLVNNLPFTYLCIFIGSIGDNRVPFFNRILFKRFYFRISYNKLLYW